MYLLHCFSSGLSNAVYCITDADCTGIELWPSTLETCCYRGDGLSYIGFVTQKCYNWSVYAIDMPHDVH